jgi:hypothetical protein
VDNKHEPIQASRLIEGQEIYLRTQDRARLKRLVQGVFEEKLCAVLVSDSDDILDHYGRMLSRELRAQKGLTVEVFSPDSTEAVLVRFNRLLSDLRVADAIAPAAETDPGRALVVYDGRATGLREVQLLGRLFKDFPGANTRMVLLLHSSGADAEAKAEALGARTIRWEALRPSPEEARALLTEADQVGMKSEAQAVLDRVGVKGMEAAMALRAGLRALSRADEALSENSSGKPSEDPEGTEALTRAQQFAASMAKAKAEQHAVSALSKPEESTGKVADVPGPSKKSRKLPPILLVGLLALSASAAITLVQQLPPGLMKGAQDALSGLISSEPVTAEVTSPSGSTNPGPQTSTDTPSTAKTLGPMPERLTDLEIQQDPQLRAQQAELTVSQRTDPVPPLNVETDTERAPKAVKSASPALMRQVSAGWYVQHLSRDSRAAIEQFYKAQPKLAKARVLRLKRIGAEGDNWVLLSGPFNTLEEAKTFMKTPGLGKDMWVRPASAIRKMLPDGSGG